MTIGLVADPCDPSKPGGLGRYVYELVRAVLAVDTENSFIVFTKTPLPGIAAEQRMLPKNVWLEGAHALDASLDVYIFFTPVIPIFFRPRKAIVIVQDFAYLELPRTTLQEKALALASYLMHRRSLRIADSVVGISASTTQSVIRHFNLAPQKCVTIPIAAMPAAEPVAVKNLPQHFFLFAGVLKERKNVATLIRAFARFAQTNAEYQFLIAGKTGGAYYESLIAGARELGIESRVRFLGYVSDGELSYLYSKAAALVFASLVEGFGMPVLEAFRAGVPVITSNEGALAEVAGAAALLVDPRSPASIATALQRVAEDPALRRTLVERGLARAKLFSWEASARQLQALISSLV
jgi:glycosyltransferase involved in cell wall biosynthesis